MQDHPEQPKQVPFAQRIVALFVIVGVIVLGGVVIITRRAQLSEVNKDNNPVTKDLPGMDPEEIDTFLSAKSAFAAIDQQPVQWKEDAVFNYLKSDGFTVEGKSKAWDIIYSSPQTNKTLNIHVDKDGIQQQYEGTGKDSQGYQQDLSSIILDSPKISELVMQDDVVSEYIKKNVGQVNPSFILMEKEEVKDALVLEELDQTALVWQVTFTFVKQYERGLEVWVDANTGNVVLVREVDIIQTEAQ